jgi:hypothetical protein
VKKIEKLIRRVGADEDLAQLEAVLARWRQELLRADEAAVATAPVSDVVEYRSHEDGILQAEMRRSVRKDGTASVRGPYWYFKYHRGGRRKTIYLGKTDNPEAALAAKRGTPR